MLCQNIFYVVNIGYVCHVDIVCCACERNEHFCVHKVCSSPVNPIYTFLLEVITCGLTTSKWKGFKYYLYLTIIAGYCGKGLSCYWSHCVQHWLSVTLVLAVLNSKLKY